jgi:3,4-dihydroxy 2-butanone 4-phosphate synthase/GTP cyclohydrolase II
MSGPLASKRRSSALASTPEIIEEIRQGRIVIMVDDESRENEGDFVLAAQHTTTERLAFIIRYSGGIVCLPMSNARADRLDLPPMVEHNTSSRGTPFTVSIEAADVEGTGISARDRAHTVRRSVEHTANRHTMVRPGHVFPLRAHDDGVLGRDGHTEAAVDLCRLAGLEAAAAISEVMHDDGTMMRLPALLEFAEQHDLKVGTIADLVNHRKHHDSM